MAIDTQGRPFGGAIMNIEEGEKFYKIYRLIPKKYPGFHFEYRILTKVKKNGNLEMAAYNYKIVKGKVEKGNVSKSDDIPPEKMDGLVLGIKNRVESASPSYMDILDLTKCKTLEEQLEKMKELDKIETQFMD